MTVTANALASRLRAIRRTAANFMSFEIDYECIYMVAVLFYGDVFGNHSLHCIVLALQPGKCEGEDDEANENQRMKKIIKGGLASIHSNGCTRRAMLPELFLSGSFEYKTLGRRVLIPGV